MMRSNIWLGWTVSLVVLGAGACGGDTATVIEATQPAPAGSSGGPEGCYLEAERRCDCDRARVDCSEQVGERWTDGCTSCAAPEQPQREGPAGCYILERMRCDCELAEGECTSAIGGVWTDGCESCAESGPG